VVEVEAVEVEEATTTSTATATAGKESEKGRPLCNPCAYGRSPLKKLNGVSTLILFFY